MIRLNDYISYIKASKDPLSADVGVIQGERCCYLFDVGNCGETAQEIQALPGEKIVVLSHFHPDHIGNLSKISFTKLYQGENTYDYTHAGEVVETPLVLESSILQQESALHLTLFPLPSSHAKGCLGLMAGDYAFLGDATYATQKAGRIVYNAGLLKEQIDVLAALPVKHFLLSHDEQFVHEKEEVLAELRAAYARRQKNDPYIPL